MDEGTAEGGDGFSSALNSLPGLPLPALGPALRGEKGEGKAMVPVREDLMTQNLGECGVSVSGGAGTSTPGSSGRAGAPKTVEEVVGDGPWMTPEICTTSVPGVVPEVVTARAIGVRGPSSLPDEKGSSRRAHRPSPLTQHTCSRVASCHSGYSFPGPPCPINRGPDCQVRAHQGLGPPLCTVRVRGGGELLVLCHCDRSP